MSTTAFRSLTAAEQIFHDLIWMPALKAGETVLEGWAPLLALPVLKQVDEFVIEQVAEYLFSQLVTLIDVTAIRLVNAEHQVAYDQASLKLKVIAHDQGINSDAFKAARDDAKKALSQFVRFGATV